MYFIDILMKMMYTLICKKTKEGFKLKVLSRKLNLFFILAICIFSISSIGLAKTHQLYNNNFSTKQYNDLITINAMVCDSCGQNTVILQKEYFSSATLVESELAGSNNQYCSYCSTTRKFNHYDVYSKKYDYYNYWHECLNCGWHSTGWTGKTLVSKTQISSYDECTVCGMEK